MRNSVRHKGHDLGLKISCHACIALEELRCERRLRHILTHTYSPDTSAATARSQRRFGSRERVKGPRRSTHESFGAEPAIADANMLNTKTIKAIPKANTTFPIQRHERKAQDLVRARWPSRLTLWIPTRCSEGRRSTSETAPGISPDGNANILPRVPVHIMKDRWRAWCPAFSCRVQTREVVVS